MHYEYKTENTCSQSISFDINDNVITNISFYGGCNGNLKAISTLLEGATVEEIEEKLLGNTKKLADTIANAVLAESKDLSNSLEESVDILFLGCSYYAFDVDVEVKRFINENKEKIGKIVCFGTSAMMKSMKRPIAKVAEPLGVAIAEEEFHCRGQFGKMHKGRPNMDDLNEVSAFAKRVIGR